MRTKHVMWPTTLAAIAVAGALALGVSAAQAQNKCLSGKTKCVSKNASCMLQAEEVSQKTGQPNVWYKCWVKFYGGTEGFEKSCFGKLELKNDGPCLTFGDLDAEEAKVEAFVADVVLELYDSSPPNKCSAGKLKCVRKKTACILTVHSKAQKLGLPLDPAELQKCYDKFDGGTKGPDAGCFAKLEAKQDPLEFETVCPSVADAATQEAKVDAFVADVLAELGAP